MKKTISREDFHEAFKDAGRGNRFSGTALDALFDYMEKLEMECGEQYELDVDGLCLDYSEEPCQDAGVFRKPHQLIANLKNGNYLVRDY